MTVDKYVDTNDTFFVSFGGDLPCSRVQGEEAKKLVTAKCRLAAVHT